MKKFLVLFLALSMMGGVAFAQDLGLDVGAQFVVGTLNPDEGDAMDTAFLRPFVAYSNSDLVENLTVRGELGVPLWFINPADQFWAAVDLVLAADYAVELSPEGTLTATLESRNGFVLPVDDMAMLAVTDVLGPIVESKSVLRPAVRYDHALDGMNVYGRIRLPMTVFYGDVEDPFDSIGINIMAGFNMGLDFGTLGANVTLNGAIAGEYSADLGGGDKSFIQSLEIMPYFENGPLYAELTVAIPLYSLDVSGAPSAMEIEGLTITPRVEYQIQNNLGAWLELPLSGIASDEGDVYIGLNIGVKYSM